LLAVPLPVPPTGATLGLMPDAPSAEDLRYLILAVLSTAERPLTRAEVARRVAVLLASLELLPMCGFRSNVNTSIGRT
jgi:hypothetical protein